MMKKSIATEILRIVGVLTGLVLTCNANSLVVTNGEILEMGGVHNFNNVLISNGTIYLTNDTVIASSGDISILSGGTITWRYTTTNWSTNIYLNSNGRGGNGSSVFSKNGSNAWNMTLQAASNLTINGTINLRGGAGQTHIGNAAQGVFGGDFYNSTTRNAHKGGTGGCSYGGNGGQGATLFLKSLAGNIDARNATLILSGGDGGMGGDGGTGGEGGSTPSGQGADGGDGGDSFGGNGGNGGQLIIRTETLRADSWLCLQRGGIGAYAGNGGEGGFLGFGSWGMLVHLMAEGGFWNGSFGASGESYNGVNGANGMLDVVKQAKPQPRFENGLLSLDLDMTSTSATYIVECCTNLLEAEWKEVDAFPGYSGEMRWADSLTNQAGKCFYRIQTIY